MSSTKPTVKIAMFGSRSTGKTNFLASFFGIEDVPECSIDFSDEETRSKLHKNWMLLLDGKVPSATGMVDEKGLKFTLRQTVRNQATDEWLWNVVMKDYPGKLMEEIPDGMDEISEEIKHQLDKYIQDADAILFLAPVEIRDWTAVQQKQYLSYIKNCISIARKYRDQHGRSIPFCLALMKWDQTGIKIPSVHIGKPYEIDSNVLDFLKENPIFVQIYKQLKNNTNLDMAIFATSSYGAHLEGDNTLPDPEHLKPLNVMQILQWICVQVEESRLVMAEQEVKALSEEVESDERYSAIQQCYQKLLDAGINDPKVEADIRQKASVNHDRHTDFYTKQYEFKLVEIQDDKRGRNQWAEQAKLLQDRLERGLYLPDDERTLRHDLEDLKTKASRRDGWIAFWRAVIGAGIVFVVLLLIWLGRAIHNGRCYTQGEAVLNGKAPEEWTADMYERAAERFATWPCFLENYLWWLNGRRDKFMADELVYFAALRQELNAGLEKIAIPETPKEKAEALRAQIRLIQSYAPDAQSAHGKRMPEVVYKEFRSMLKDKQDQVSKILNSLLQTELNSIPKPDGEKDFVGLQKQAKQRAECYRKHAQDFPELSSWESELKGKAQKEDKMAVDLLKDVEIEKLQKELDKYPVKGLDVDSLYRNATMRVGICEKHLKDAQPEIRPYIEHALAREKQACEQFNNWKKFEDGFKNFETAMDSELSPRQKIDKCAAFLKEIQNAEYQKYPTLNEKRLIVEFKKLEAEMKENPGNYNELHKEMTELDRKMSPYLTNSEVHLCWERLKNMKDAHKAAWEKSAYSNVQKTIQTLKLNPSVTTIKDAAAAVEKYLKDEDAPQEHKAEVEQAQKFLNDLQELRDITVTIKKIHFENTKFKGWRSQNVVFTFSFADAKVKITCTEDGTQEQKSNTVKASCTCGKIMVQADSNAAGRKGHGSESVDLLKRIVNGESMEFDIGIKDKKGQSMQVKFSVSGCPKCPEMF